MANILKEYIPDTKSIPDTRSIPDIRSRMDEDMYTPIDDYGDDLTPEETKRMLEDYRP